MLFNVAADYESFGYSRDSALEFVKEALHIGISAAHMVINIIEKGVY